MGKAKATRSRVAVPLSKTAKMIVKRCKFPRGVSRLIGMFSGTDVKYYVGDTFIKKTGFAGGIEGMGRSIAVPVLKRLAGRGYIRWFDGIVYLETKVVGVTPCSIVTKLMKTYYVLGKLHSFNPKPVFDPSKLAAIFVQNHDDEKRRRFMLPSDDNDEFRMSKVAYMVDDTIESFDEIRYDVLNDWLCKV